MNESNLTRLAEYRSLLGKYEHKICKNVSRFIRMYNLIEKYKNENNISKTYKEQEKSIYKNVLEMSSGKVNPKLVIKIFKLIIKQAKHEKK